MRKRVHLSVIFGLIAGICQFSSGQTPIRGRLSGTLERGVYLVLDSVYVLREETLIIEPGVTFLFQGRHNFTIYGYLQAEGTTTDSIRFMMDPGMNGGWGSIIFRQGSSDSCRMSYCHITGAFGSGINVYYTGVTISNCTITGNRANWGGGIYCSGSATTSPVKIIDCVITDNWCGRNGGGIYSTRGPTIIENCIVTGNLCNMAGTGSGMGGGGICHNHGATGRIERCLIANNFTKEYGGGISCNDNSNSDIVNCTIYGNEAGFAAGGIFVGLSRVNIVNNIIACNEGTAGIGLSNSPEVRISFNSLFDNKGGDFRGDTVAPWLGQITSVNNNGDSCDLRFNIYMNPLMVDPGNGDFSLRPDSPCIDAGNPESSADPDGTIADIGAFYFHQNPVSSLDRPLAASGSIPFTVHPNPFNPAADLKFNLTEGSHTRLTIYDIQGKLVATLVERRLHPGAYTFRFEGLHLPSGVYFADLFTGGIHQTRKLLLVK